MALIEMTCPFEPMGLLLLISQRRGRMERDRGAGGEVSGEKAGRPENRHGDDTDRPGESGLAEELECLAAFRWQEADQDDEHDRDQRAEEAAEERVDEPFQ